MKHSHTLNVYFTIIFEIVKLITKNNTRLQTNAQKIEKSRLDITKAPMVPDWGCAKALWAEPSALEEKHSEEDSRGPTRVDTRQPLPLDKLGG